MPHAAALVILPLKNIERLVAALSAPAAVATPPLSKSDDPLMPPVLFRMPKFYPFQPNPQPQPPYRQPAQPAQTRGTQTEPCCRSGSPFPQAIFPEHPLKQGLHHPTSRKPAQPLAAQQIPVVRIANGEWITTMPVACPKPTLKSTHHTVRPQAEASGLTVGVARARRRTCRVNP